jgi:hypothetical protein
MPVQYQRSLLWCSVVGIFVVPRTLARIAIACLVPPVLACGRFAKLDRCQDLAEKVNPVLDKIERGTKKRTPATYGSASRAYAALARDLRAHLPDGGPDAGPPPALDAFERGVEEYRAVLEAASRHTAGLAAALDAGNTASATLEARQLEELTRQAKAVSKRIDNGCRPEF